MTATDYQGLGTGAAIFAGQAAVSSYGRPLRVRGIAALAPAADTGPEFAGQTPPGPVSPSSPSHDVVLQLNVFRGFAAAYPKLATDSVVAPPGAPALRALDVECTIHLGDVIQELGTDPATMVKRPVPADWHLPGATHQTIPFVSQNEYVRWIADRFSRRAAPSTCAS